MLLLVSGGKPEVCAVEVRVQLDSLPVLINCLVVLSCEIVDCADVSVYWQRKGIKPQRSIHFGAGFLDSAVKRQIEPVQLTSVSIVWVQLYRAF